GDQIGQQIAPVYRGRVPAGGVDRRRQPLPPSGLARPYQAFQPADVIVVGDVQRVQVEPGAPGDLGDLRRDGDRAQRSAAEDGRVRVRSGELATAVFVGVPVREQGEP